MTQCNDHQKCCPRHDFPMSLGWMIRLIACCHLHLAMFYAAGHDLIRKGLRPLFCDHDLPVENHCITRPHNCILRNYTVPYRTFQMPVSSRHVVQFAVIVNLWVPTAQCLAAGEASFQFTHCFRVTTGFVSIINVARSFDLFRKKLN